MKILPKPGQRLTIETVLDFAEQMRADAERKFMSDLLQHAADIDDWDQVSEAIAAFNEDTAGWREELRAELEAFAAESRRSSQN